MKQKVFIYDNTTISKLKEYVKTLPNGRYEVVIRDARQSKTLEQLGALWGVWMDYISDHTGHDVVYIHKWMKAAILARIYIKSPQNPQQEQWVELLYKYQESGEQDKLEIHAKRISSSWATVKQYKEYMNKIEQFWINKDLPLPQLRKDD